MTCKTALEIFVSLFRLCVHCLDLEMPFRQRACCVDSVRPPWEDIRGWPKREIPEWNQARQTEPSTAWRRSHRLSQTSGQAGIIGHYRPEVVSPPTRPLR